MPSLLEESRDLLAQLMPAYRAWARRYAGTPRVRAGIHTLYVGAHRFDDGAVARLGAEARAVFERHAATPRELAKVLGWPSDELSDVVHTRVARKLSHEPIEDIRIDFEDGYGVRSDDEENAEAERAARAVPGQVGTGVGLGIRIKPLSEELGPRAIETLARFVTTLVRTNGGALPEGFVVTLPKVVVPEQVHTMAALLARLEARLGLPRDAIRLEIMVEVTSSLFSSAGALLLPRYLDAGGARLVGVHMGVYDYTASYEVPAQLQALDHPACDAVRDLLRVAYGGTGVVLSAGSTNVLPVPADGESEPAAVARAWSASHAQIRHILARGYYHGWDMHPGQIPVRFATCYRFFREAYPEAARRLRAYLERAVSATDDAAIIDDAATGEAWLTFFRRAHRCGALTTAELEPAGLTPADFALSSFVDVMKARR